MNNITKHIACAISLIYICADCFAYAGPFGEPLDWEYSTEALLAVYCAVLPVVAIVSALYYRSRKSLTTAGSYIQGF